MNRHPSLRPRRRLARRPPAAMRRKRLRPVNPERLARVHRIQFGPPERRAWIAALPCATCGRVATPAVPNHNSHVRHTRGAGGRPEDIIPQCWSCHVALEGEGIETFCSRRNSTPAHLEALADKYARRWAEIEAALEGGPP